MEMDQEAIEVPLLEGYVSSSTAISPSEDGYTTATKRRTIATHKSAGSPDCNITNKKNVAHKILPSLDNNKLFQDLNNLVRRHNKTSEQEPLLGCANRSDSHNADTPKHEFVRPTTADVKSYTNAKQRIRQKTSDEEYRNIRRNDGTNAPIQVKQKSKQKSNKQHKITCSKSIIDTAHNKKKNVATPSAALETLDALTNSIQNLSQNPPTDVVKLATVNSFNDAPTTLSDSLPINNLVRRELFMQVAETTENVLKRRTIAVNPPTILSMSNANSKGFGIFIEYLHDKDLVALLACDSGRVGFIVPRSSTAERNGCYSAHLYYAPMDEFVRRASTNYNGVAPSGGGAVTVAVHEFSTTNSIEACLATNTSSEAIRPLTPPSSISNNREPRGIENGNNGSSRSSNVPPNRQKRWGRQRLWDDKPEDVQLTNNMGDGYNGRSGRGSSRGPGPNFGGDSISSWRGDNNELLPRNIEGGNRGRGGRNAPNEHSRGGNGGRGGRGNGFPPMRHSWGGSGGRGGRGHQSSGLVGRQPLGNLSNNVATKPPPKPPRPPPKDTGRVYRIDAISGIGEITPQLCMKPVYFQTRTVGFSIGVGDIVEFTYQRKIDEFVVINIKRLSTAQEEAHKIWDNKPRPVVPKRKITKLPDPVEEEEDPDLSPFTDDDPDQSTSPESASVLISVQGKRSSQIYNDGSDIVGLATKKDIIAFVGDKGCSVKAFEKRFIHGHVKSKGDHAYALLRCLATFKGGGWYILRKSLSIVNDEHKEIVSKLYHCAVSVESRPYEFVSAEVIDIVMRFGYSKSKSETFVKRLAYDYWEKKIHISRQKEPAVIGPEQQKEDDDFRKREMNKIYNSNRILGHSPREAVCDIKTLIHIRRGDSHTISFGACPVQESGKFSGANMSCSGCIKDGKNLAANCSTKNFQSIAQGFSSSSLHCGIIPNVSVRNGESRCPTLHPDYQFCREVQKEMGRERAEDVTNLVRILNALDCHVFICSFAGPTSMLDERVVEKLDSTICKHVCRATTHFTNFTVGRLCWSIEDQRLEMVHVVGTVSYDYVQSIKTHNKTAKIQIPLPDKTPFDYGLEDERLIFIETSLEKTLKGMLRYHYGDKSLVLFCRNNVRVYGDLPIKGKLLSTYHPFLLRHLEINLEELKDRTDKEEDEITLSDVHKRICSRGGDTSFARKAGLFNPKNAAAVKAGNERGGENSMALLGKNDKGDSVRASSMGDTTFARKAGLFNPKNAAAVKAGNERGGKNSTKGRGGNTNIDRKSVNLSVERNKYISTNSTHWVMFGCQGYGDNETCPHGTVRYYGNNTEGAKEYQDDGKGYLYRRKRNCPCGPTLSSKGIPLSTGTKHRHEEWEEIGTISDEKYMIKFGADAFA